MSFDPEVKENVEEELKKFCWSVADPLISKMTLVFFGEQFDERVGRLSDRLCAARLRRKSGPILREVLD